MTTIDEDKVLAGVIPPSELSGQEQTRYMGIFLQLARLTDPTNPASPGTTPDPSTETVDTNGKATTRDELRAVLASKHHHSEFLRGEYGTRECMILQKELADLVWMAGLRRQNDAIHKHEAQVRRAESARERLLREAPQAMVDELKQIDESRNKIVYKNTPSGPVAWLAHLRETVAAARKTVERLTKDGEPANGSTAADDLARARGRLNEEGVQVRQMEAELARLDAREAELVAAMIAS